MNAARKLDVRPAGVFSLALLAELHAACFTVAWTECAIARLLALPGAFALLACWQDEPAGFALGHVTADEAELWAIGVLAGRRRHGIADALLTASLSRVREAGAASLFLEVGERNAAALELYRRRGFLSVGRRAAYYAHAGASEAALVMRHTWPPPAATVRPG